MSTMSTTDPQAQLDPTRISKTKSNATSDDDNNNIESMQKRLQLVSTASNQEITIVE